uniref:Uncharacterized protein n=1 Tax=Tanacetum cinerariifolium TaxID=118510 RepID=A0A699HQF6_TANCI|nr:hypothetical protein [Tanacetum cinerariifolium]
MNLIATQQAALDNSLVAPEKRLKIKRCFVICPQLPNQNFVEIPSEDDLLSFIKELGYSGNYEMLSTIRTDQMHQPWRTFDVVLNKCIFGKTTGLDKLKELRAQIIINLHTVCDDTLLGTLKFISKTEDYQKYEVLIPDEMINEDIKLSTAYKTYLDYATRKVPPKKARKFKKLASPKLKTVPIYPKEPTKKEILLTSRYHRRNHQLRLIDTKARLKTQGESEDESDGVHDEDGNDDDIGNDAQDSERTISDDDDNPSFTLKDYEEEEQDEEYLRTPDKDKSDDEEKMYEEEDDDVAKELTDHQNASFESWFVHEEEDAHVTLTTIHDKTEGPLQRSSVSSDFTSKLLNLDNLSLDINSLMDSFIRLDRGTK